MPHYELKKAAGLLKTRIQEEDIVAVSNIFKFLHIFNYLNRPFKLVTTPQELRKHYLLKIFAFKNDEAIMDFNLLKDKKRLWLIMEKDAAWLFSVSTIGISSGYLVNDSTKLIMRIKTKIYLED